jgi:16S rRNA (guanine966-N2)-methyltransferase
MKRNAPRASQAQSKRPEEPVVGLRIIGGKLRGRKLQYSGDLRTRPMKDRVREAVFNLLGPGVNASHAIDLFAGTGALGLEAISRGAKRATFIERHLPTTRLIEQNAAALGVAQQADVVFGDAFLWVRRWVESAANAELEGEPWTIFCSPPYDFYAGRREEMLTMLRRLVEAAPAESLFVVEADERFDFGLLSLASQWDVRSYPPAVVGILTKRDA